jgi:phosphate-selective porin OprO/OprP
VAVQSALLATSSPLWAKQPKAANKEARIEALEQRLLQLEQRLAESEARNQQLAAGRPAEKVADAPTVKQLDQKVKVLERKLEVDKEVAEAAKKSAPKLEAGPEGVRFISADGDHTVRLRGSVQADAKFFMDDNARKAKDVATALPGSTGSLGNNLPDRFELRQARVWLEGSLWKNIDFKIMPEFGGGTIRLFDAYIDAHYFPFASLTAGKIKPPVSLERLQGDADGAFLERAYPTYLAPNRDIGVMLHGEFARPGYKAVYGGPEDFKNFFDYQLGIFNGTGDNGNGDNDIDDDKEFTGRLWSHPFQHSGIDALEGLGIGIAGTWEQPKQKGPLNALSDEIGQSRIVDYNQIGFAKSAGTANATNAVSLVANGDHYRVYPQAYWYWGPFGLMGEYVLSSQHLLGQELTSTNNRVRSAGIQQNNTAWQAQASYVLTGEDNTFQSVKPRAPFDPVAGNWGALQAVARWSELDVDDKSFAPLDGLNAAKGTTARLLDPTRSISHATSWSVGLNWFLNRNFRLMADYEQTYFEGGAGSYTKAGILQLRDRPNEKVFGTRFQLVF